MPDHFFFVNSTWVEFFNYTDKIIDIYVKSGEGFDKSGSYSIEGLGTFLIKKINGSFNSVVGFPIEKFIYLAFKKGLLKT